ncbi:AfsR/SARP family transcriptional regulator [Virgisporangium aurantiacum]|uniref:XRE family transcriptional regulator n=1 Tax=Virgisporangium aurantiacum TaxID=175570 RepID=A0A8J3ZGV6_9ACTN|nr:tetratricopeptide repeat protein [Virgisporangium aurantiacum]GIJ61148.1 XRE family transcriptional regulator [Virgisporangium aurantiacum]
MLVVQVLGQVRVWYGTDEIPLGPPGRRAVLGLLVLAGDRPVTRAELVDALWGDAPPTSAANVVQSHVMHLRRVLEPTRSARSPSRRIRTVGDGYRLITDDASVDLTRFRELVVAADRAEEGELRAEAAGLLGDALALWRGPALADVPALAHHRWVEGLGLDRRRVLARYVDAMVGTGRASGVVSTAVADAAENPLDESAQARLVRVYRSMGQRGQALEVYHRARQRLAEELGVVPGPELGAALSDLLRDGGQQTNGTPGRAGGTAGKPGQPGGMRGRAGGTSGSQPPARNGPPAAVTPTDPRTAGTLMASSHKADGRDRRDRPTPRQLPADVGAFVGRGPDLDGLDRLGGEPDGRPVIAVICGAAGVGKTAFALRWAHRARDRFPDGQLYLDLRGYGTGTPLSAPDALGHLCVALGRSEADLPADPAERAALFRTESAGRRLLIVLDNAASADQIRPLLPGSGPSMVLVTSRDHLGGLVALDGANRVELAPLPTDDAVALLRLLIGPRVADDPHSAETLVEQCARLPLALRVAAELAASWPAESLSGIAGQLADRHARLDLLDVGGDTSAAVREVLSWSFHHLDAVAALAFRRLALHPGPEFDALTVAALSSVDDRTAARALGVLARGHLVEPCRSGRYRMHDLLRAYAEEVSRDLDDADARATATEALLDHYLGGVCRARAVLYPTWHGYLPSPGSPGGPELADAAAAVAWLDREQANLTALCAHAARNGWPRHAIAIAANLQRHFEGGRYRDGLTVHSFALAAAGDLGDDAAVAHLRAHVGEIHRLLGRYDVAADRLREALAGHRRTGDLRGEARALSGLGIVAERTGDHASAVRHHRDALTRYRRADDRRGEAGVLVNLGNAYSGQDEPARAADAFEQAWTIFRDLAEPTGEAAALSNLGDVLSTMGEPARAAERLAEALPLFRAAGHRNGEAVALTNLGQVKLRLGAVGAALEDLSAAIRIFEETGHRYGEASARNGMGEALGSVGRDDEALAYHRAALTIATETQDHDEQRRAELALAALNARHG